MLERDIGREIQDSSAADRKERRKGTSQLVLVGVLVAAIAAFVGQNSQTVSFQWLVFSFSAPLWLMLVVTIASGILASHLSGFVVKRRRNKNAKKKKT